MKNKKKTKVLLLSIFLFILLFVSFKKIYTFAISLNVSLTVSSELKITIQWVIPEARSGANGTNDDIAFFLTFRNPLTHGIDYTTDIYNTDVDGTYVVTPIDIGYNVIAGNYDVGLKGNAHLTKVLRGIDLQDGLNNLNFTQSDNSATKGSVRLVAGDINGDGLTPSTMGDDVINSVDLSAMLTSLDADDVTGNGIRANLNQDPVVNSVDLSLMISNLDKEGDK